MNILIISSAILAMASCATRPISPTRTVKQLQGVSDVDHPSLSLVKSSENFLAHGPLAVRAAGELTPEELEQNKNAFYHFESNIDDKINDQTQQRSETREGLNVKGTFSYSDGFLKRTVRYEADENGYRIVGEETEPLDGPKVNLEGTAEVHAAAHGTDLKYKIQSIPGEGERSKIDTISS